MNNTTFAATAPSTTMSPNLDPARPRYQEESILVVPRPVLERVCPRVYSKDTAPVRAAVLENYSFLERNLAEHDPSFKQVIPYVVVKHEDDYLLIRRTKKQGESRLHDKFSLGIGGHINDTDVAGVRESDIIEAGMRRELVEEIGLDGEKSCKLVGIINDDSTEVARVHVGFVYLLETTTSRFTIAETDKYTAEWQKPDSMREFYDRMESWAQIVYDHLIMSR